MENTLPVMLYDSLIDSDQTSRFLYVAPGPCREILELDPDALVKDMSLVWDIVHPDDMARFCQEDLVANKSGQEFKTEVRIITPSGHLKWLLVNSKPNPSEPGKPVVWSGYLQDITKRKQAELKLQESEHRFRSFFERSLDAIFLAVRDGAILAANPAACAMFERTEEELCEIGCSEILDMNDSKFSMILEKWQRDGHVHSDELMAIRKSGIKFPVEIDSVIYQKHSEKSFVIIRDITSRKHAYKEQQTVEKLKSVGTLAGGIAHDFNNILTGLFGNITLAKMKLASDQPGFRYLEAAEVAMNRAALLTNQLLTFAKGGDPVKKSLNLISLLEEIVNFSLSGSNVKPIITSSADLWPASIDHGQIEQVFANLTINAREAMPNGGHLNITVENSGLAEKAVTALSGGQYLRIIMSDEGTGIDPELLDKIFDPYFTTKLAGSGLGLATAYSIINKHGGHINVTSQLGRGTTFTIYLPAASVAEPLLDHSEPFSVAQDKTAKVLVMDDEVMICNMLKDLLGELGFEVETAVDGKQAIEMYREARASRPFDVVILDLTVPGGMGGKEVAKGLLQIDPEARIIVSSGYSGDPVMANCADYGFKGVVSKPYSPGKLSEVLTQVLKNG